MKEFTSSYFEKLKVSIDSVDLAKVQQAAEMIFDAYQKDKQVFVIGNGGSASTASHFACDLGKGTLKNTYAPGEKRFKAFSFTDNVATLLAYGNDISFDDIFVQQLQNLLNEGDIVIGISGSGNSPNVLKAILYAKEKNAKTIGLSGFQTGGKLAGLVDCGVVIADNHYGRIEDIHLMLCHVMSDAVFELKNKKQNLES